jgi:hypothetical protein
MMHAPCNIFHLEVPVLNGHLSETIRRSVMSRFHYICDSYSYNTAVFKQHRDKHITFSICNSCFLITHITRIKTYPLW